MARNEIEIINLSDSNFKCVIKNTTLEYVNNLRQKIWDVPTLAFTNGVIHKNSSLAKDTNMILQRIYLTPVLSDAIDLFNDPETCPCQQKRCDKCALQFEIDVTNNTPTPLMVTSNHITRCEKNRDGYQTVQVMSNNGKNFIEIVELLENQSFKATFCAQKGIGAARWLAASAATFRNVPSITVNNDLLTIEQRKLMYKCCPQKVFDLGTKGEVIVARPLDCSACRECLNINKQQPKSIQINDVKSSFIFSFENKGTVSTMNILRFLELK